MPAVPLSAALCITEALGVFPHFLWSLLRGSLAKNPPLPPVHSENPIPVSASPHLLGLGFFFLALLGFPGGSDGKESTCNVGDLGLIPGMGRYPGGGLGNPLQYPCLENPHGQRSLVGYSPWGHKESDMTEQLSTA